MELQVGVKILLRNSEGKYLLLRRNPKKYQDMRASWDMVGGRINPGTSLADNLSREIKEEVGLDYSGKPKLIAAQDIFVHRYTDGTDSTVKSSEIVRHVVRLTFTGEIDGQPQLSDEHLEGGWLSSEEIKNIEPGILDSFFKELIDKKIISL